jgi:hypothetical protein
MGKLNKGPSSKPNQPKGGRLTDHGRKKRPGATPEQMRSALRGMLLGSTEGKTWSINQAPEIVDGVTKSVLARTLTNVCKSIRKMGYDGHEDPPKGKARKVPRPEEDSKHRKDLGRLIRAYYISLPWT